jgi:hypothetical protein
MPIQKILNRFTGKVLFEVEAKSLKVAVEIAVSRGADLWRADLWRADLRGADLREAYLRGADLRGADLRGADLWRADLWRADLREAYLRGADLRGADLWGADLRGADLREAYLKGADLRGADLWGADLRGADSLNQPEIKRRANCPLSGEFIAWKKLDTGAIAKLKIPAWARRVSPIVGRKCRAELAIVLEIDEQNGRNIKEMPGQYDHDTVYRVGRVVSPDSYDASPLVECSHGIHFFLTRQEAEDW